MTSSHLSRRAMLRLLAGSLALAGCTPQLPGLPNNLPLPGQAPALTPSPAPGSAPAPGPAATAVPTPTAIPNRSPAEQKVREAARLYFDTWQRGDYASLYQTLATSAKGAITQDRFVARYTAIGEGVGITQLQAKDEQITLLPDPAQPNRADVAFTVTMQSSEVGPIEERNTLPLSLEDGQWRVNWTPDLIFRDLAGDRVVRVEPGQQQRGSILDRQGRTLAGSGNTLSVGVVPGNIEDEGRALQALSTFLGRKPEEIKARYAGAQPTWWVPLAEYPASKRAEAESKLGGIAGVELRDVESRLYPLGPAAAHLTGYLSQVTADDLARLGTQGYVEDDLVGRTGIEAWGESSLRGDRAGKVLIAEVNGKVVRTVADRSTKPPAAVQLTIDQDLQQLADRVLGDKTGSIVLMDPRDNAILAMVSHPSYDPNAFITGISNAEWQRLSSDPKHPFQNRPAQSAYPTGSIFKVITMTAGLEKGGFQPNTPFSCNGTWTGLPGLRMGDWKPEGHGNLDLSQGLVESCDIVFYELSKKLDATDPKILPDFSRQFGLGALTGVVGVEEVEGTIPDPDWKQRTLQQPWYGGDAINLGIGQGYMEATPLQMANVYAALANGGELRKPLLVRKVGEGATAKEYKAEAVRRLPGSPETLKAIHEALVRVASSAQGTAYYAFQGFKVPTAAKTGSAENQNPDAHAWFAAYAPADKPEIVVLVMVEGGRMGGEVAAPLGRQVLEGYFTGR
ncbi:MAG: penicillin-binding protein 2 [Chloroflexota bacterium]